MRLDFSESANINETHAGAHGTYFALDAPAPRFAATRVILGPLPVSRGHPNSAELLVSFVKRSTAMGMKPAPGKVGQRHRMKHRARGRVPHRIDRFFAQACENAQSV